MWEMWVVIGLVAGLLVLVGFLFWLMFRDRRFQMEQMLSAWNQSLNTQIRVIDDLTKELTKEREISVGERNLMMQMMSHMEKWLTYVVEAKLGEPQAMVDGSQK